MAFDAEKIAALTDPQLKALGENVSRLGVSGTPAQRIEAARLEPMIQQERAARKPAKAPPRAGAVKRKPKA